MRLNSCDTCFGMFATLLFVVGISMTFEARDDIRRHRKDNEVIGHAAARAHAMPATRSTRTGNAWLLTVGKFHEVYTR